MELFSGKDFSSEASEMLETLCSFGENVDLILECELPVIVIRDVEAATVLSIHRPGIDLELSIILC